MRPINKATQLLRATVSDPVELGLKVLDVVAERRERGDVSPDLYAPSKGWEARLHVWLGSPWPCPAVEGFWELWPQVTSLLEARGLKVGRGAFGGWGDGEPGITRAIWCLVLHSKPQHVIETGVARGITSRFILEGLERNRFGHLWSVDLPPQLKSELHDQIGAAVPPEMRSRWTYVRGSSRRRLPRLLRDLGSTSLFVHDSRHTERNVRFELDRAWPVLGPGGYLVVDDIDVNHGFHSFVTDTPGIESMVCEAEPSRPDPGRYNGRGLFGIVRRGVRLTS